MRNVEGTSSRANRRSQGARIAASVTGIERKRETTRGEPGRTRLGGGWVATSITTLNVGR